MAIKRWWWWWYILGSENSLEVAGCKHELVVDGSTALFGLNLEHAPAGLTQRVVEVSVRGAINLVHHTRLVSYLPSLRINVHRTFDIARCQPHTATQTTFRLAFIYAHLT